MKKITSKSALFAIGGIALVTLFSIASCSKSSSSGSTTPPPTLIGGYASSDSVASSNLIAYWPFDADANDHVSGAVATAVGVTFPAGLRGNSYQGGTGSYATLTPSAAFNSLTSYSMSFWYKLAAQQPSGDPGGIFFLAGTTTLNELIDEIESYAPVSNDSVQIHHGFTNLANPSAPYQGFTMTAWDTAAVGKWVHVVTTYDGGSSTYTIYQDGIAILNYSAWSPASTSTILYQDNTPGSSYNTLLQGNLSWASDPPKTIIIGTWPPTLYGVSPTLGANGCFLGQLDELRIFNKALSQSEVAGLYLNGLAGR